MTHIASVAYADPSKFSDNTNGVNPKNQAYEYAISVIDTCGNETALSASHITIHLATPQFALPNIFSLQWTDFQGFPFAKYEIWRDGNNTGNWTKIGNVNYGVAKTYTDNAAPTKSARYRIEVRSPASGCIIDATPADTIRPSISNISDDETAVSEISLDNFLSVYPNPNHGAFTVQMSGARYNVLDIKVYNMLGELIYEASVKNQKSEITIPGISGGVYHLQVITDKGIANKKIMIQ
jgi:hypothetical protein